MIEKPSRKRACEKVLVERPDGVRQYMPRQWTDLEQADRYPEGMRFPVAQLLLLRQRLDEMLEERGILSTDEMKNKELSGGRNGETAGRDVERAQLGGTTTGDRRAGGDAAGLSGETGGGER